MAELLDAVPSKLFTESQAGEAKKWPRRILLDLLARHPDLASIVKLMPFIEQDVRLSSINRATWTIAAVGAAIARINAQAILPAVVDILLARLRSAEGRKEQLDEKQLDDVFVAVLASLKGFARRSNFPDEQLSPADRYRERLPPTVNREVIRLVRAYMSELDKGASTSKGRPMGARTLDLLFGPRFLTPPLREIILDHCQKRGVRMKPWWWKRCMASAVAEGNVQKAEEYRDALVQVERQPGGINEHDGLGISESEPDTKLDNEEVRTLMLLSAKRPTHDVLAELQSYLAADPPVAAAINGLDEKGLHYMEDHSHGTTAAYAWSILLDKLANDPRIDANTITRLTDSMPQGVLTAPTITPAMQGLLIRQEPAQAWDLWTRYIRQHRTTSQSDLDGTLLGVAAEADFQLRGLESSIAFVDRHARRPPLGPSPEPDYMAQISAAENRLNIPLEPPEIIIDVHVLNRLLHQCLLSHRPSVAFRLFHAGLPRWGVWPDEISLALLIDAARYAPIAGDGQGDDVLHDRLREIADAFSFRRMRGNLSDADADEGSYDAYDAIGFAKGGPNVLLDPPGYTWRAEHGRVRPWEKARQVFRQVMLGNWPHLAEIPSPLDVGGAFASITDFFMHRDSSPPRGAGKPNADGTSQGRMPRETARYPHLVPSARTFHSYVCMLGFYASHEEIPAVLAWMRDRGVVPRWETMLMALMHVCENEGPRRPVGGRLMRDEEILRAWLEDWLNASTDSTVMEDGGQVGYGRAWGPERDLYLGLGKERTGKVPSEDQVARWIRHIRSRRENITA